MIREISRDTIINICVENDEDFHFEIDGGDSNTYTLLYKMVSHILVYCESEGIDISMLDENIWNLIDCIWGGLWEGNDDVSCECIDVLGREISIRMVQEDYYDQHMEEQSPEEYAELVGKESFYISGAYVYIEVY